MTALPDDWEEAPLAEIATLGSGGTPQARNPAYYGGDIPWAIIGDLTDGMVHRTQQTITQLGLSQSSAKIVPADTVLLAMYGSIGKLGIAAAPMATNQAIATIQSSARIDGRYLFYYLLSQRRELDRHGKGATQRNISQTILKPWLVRFPTSLDEQKSIVDLLEGHLSRLDAADKGLYLSLAKLKGLREQAIIHALTATEVPDRVDAALADVGTADGGLPSLPVGWSWARLGDVAEVVGGVTKDSKKQGDPSFVEVPYLRVANVQRGHLNLETVTHIRVDPAKAKTLRLEEGDVLLNEGGDRDKLARGWVWEGQIDDCIHQNHVFRARLNEPRLDPYFLSWTTNIFGGRWAERNGKQSVNLASISLSMIRKMPVIVPADGEAQRVVVSLHDQLASYDRLASALTESRNRGKALRRSLLTAAFSGRLLGGHTDASVAEEMIHA